MPMTKVCDSAPATGNVVAVRPTAAFRCAKCQPYATSAAAYKTSGTMFMEGSVRRWREVAEFGARGHVRARHADDDAPPRSVALGIPRRVADRVLARELVGDLAVDVVEVGQLVGEERPAACLLRELTQHELCFL